MADRQAGRGAGAGEADEMLGGNIRNEQGGADEKPSDVAAGEEIFFGAALLQGKIQADAEDDGEIDADNDEIKGCEWPVSYLDSRCEEHPCLLGVPGDRLSRNPWPKLTFTFQRRPALPREHRCSSTGPTPSLMAVCAEFR